MTHDTRIALFLMGELVAALRANEPDAFRGLLPGGMQNPRAFFVAFSLHSGQAGQSCRMYLKAKNLRIRASMHLIAF